MTDNRDNLLQTIPRLFALCATIREAAAHGAAEPDAAAAMKEDVAAGVRAAEEAARKLCPAEPPAPASLDDLAAAQGERIDLSPYCALCPNSSDSICATCMIFRLLGGRRGPWAHSRNRPAFSQKRACLSAKFGQRALPEPLCGEIPATLETAAPQQRLRLTVAGEEGIGGMAVAGKAHPAAQPAQFL